MSSILGGIKDRVLGQDEGSKRKAFKGMMDRLMDPKGMSLLSIGEMLKEQTSSWAAMIPGQAGVDSLKKYVAIIDKMAPEQIAEPEKIDKVARIQLAKAVEAEIKDVDALINMYIQFKITSVWLKYKKHKKESLPKSQADMMDMQQFDKRIRYITGELLGSKQMPYKGKKYTKFLTESEHPAMRAILKQKGKA